MRRSVFHLVRHGESVGNVDPNARRSDDPALTDRGRQQAAAAARAVASLGVDAVLTSPLRRARETAQVIADAAGLAVEPVEGFAEVDMGVLAEPRTPEDREEREAIFDGWLSGNRARAFPGGEDFPAVMRRVEAGLRVIGAAHPGGRIALVTHRMPIAAAAALAGAPGAGSCANCSITTLEHDGDRWCVVAFGDARHLA
ncbi:MAG: histidine phosphatase family protein [Myxococcales bacterium]